MKVIQTVNNVELKLDKVKLDSEYRTCRLFTETTCNCLVERERKNEKRSDKNHCRINDDWWIFCQKKTFCLNKRRLADFRIPHSNW